MIKIYWKIFLGFWLTTILILVGTALMIHQLDLGAGPRPHKMDRASRHEPQAVRLLHFAARDSINASEAEFNERIRSMPRWASRFMFVINENNDELMGRRLPKPVSKLANLLSYKKPFLKLEHAGRSYYGRLIQLEDGTSLRMVVAAHGEQRNIMLQLFLLNFWPVLLASILISGTLCFFLARYLSRPAEILKDATRRIAEGDFDYRVAPLMKGRRDEMGSLANDFDKMSEKLQQSVAEQQRLIKDVSHELRSPLMRLQFALGLAQQKSDGQVEQEIDKARKAADYLENIIADILSLPIHNQQPWPLADTIDLVLLLESLIEDLNPQCQAKAVIIEFDHASDLEDGALVATHGNSLVGVFDNLLSNALRHTPANTKLQCNIASAGNNWRVQIQDQGPGVASEFLQSIFSPFFRTDDGRDRNSGGVGLGLSIARRTIGLHNGSIEASLVKPHGLCMTVFLPKSTDSF